MTNTPSAAKTLDLIAIGRASVDLYGQQIGTRLEDIGSFAKSVGGCPANISVGTARLGLKSALVTRVGNEQMGRFILEQLARETVETSGITVDRDRLTALVLLAVEDEGVSPMIFYRSDCADMALSEADIDEALIARSRSIVVTGTHFSRPHSEAAQRKAIALAKKHGTKVVIDIDYRPNLWGLAGHDAGFERYVKSDRVSGLLRTVLADCDLIVGTEEEIMIATGADSVLASLKLIRSINTVATIVLKRGAMGCIVYDGPISDDLEDGIVGKGFPIEVFNVLGAGDAFMSGFLRGWLKGEPLATCATWANACGAFAVSRLLCSPEYPTWEELSHFLAHGSSERALRKDPALNHIHWATTRRGDYPTMMALAIDHRSQVEDLAQDAATLKRVPDFKVLAVKAAQRVAAGRPGFGMLLDDKYGQKALFAAGAGKGLWVAKPIELPGSRPLKFEFSQDIGSRLIEWPLEHCIKVLCFYHPDDPADLKAEQTAKLTTAYEAARKVGREILIEIIASKAGPLGSDTVARALTELYAAGLKPDWWKLEPQASEVAWQAIDGVIKRNDPYCRGVVLLGLEAPIETLKQGFAAAKTAPCVKGFAVGRTIFADAARRWLNGEIDDEAAIADMAQKFGTLVEVWLSLDASRAA
ncbi:5-dehydro-2-deoxygluconokinase [Pleomorphomonas diazotrophica]|uniref:5-dehydro-2-deoxygluconokinase n=1 Tax=Pleomorphomonas diazotrophica TaxID=1166257 RepID=A0A1I4S7G1_9HYPH|nr:5-dehydro-2-deoxygluconokinase [Pleomorphomonas diazotrophica]PKR89905.1 5-dehydro-2-deoxygluconokinase [Pleomorphomonas diazotrophica]SFM60213.1 5-dehydro-2-deoxygluconokinase [Pleomorphomonas diazotrophica]